MDKIKFLLKFGQRIHLESLKKGNLYFSNALNFRYYEEKLLIKGQGDRLEGGSIISVQNMNMIDNATDNVVVTSAKGSIFTHYELANLFPVYCLFTCFEKDCIKDNGKLIIRLSDEIKQNIISHFPKADTVAIINNPREFINDVHTSIGYACKADKVNYFHLLGFESDKGRVNDLEYFKYLTQDVPSKKEDGKTTYTFNEQYVYRSLLCKDVFFEKEQEYRLILPEINITNPCEFKVFLSEDIELQELDFFFSI